MQYRSGGKRRGRFECDYRRGSETNRPGLEEGSSSWQVFEILGMGLDDVDLAIIDLDPGVYSLAILEALDYSQTDPPVIAVTGLEESEMTPHCSSIWSNRLPRKTI